MKSSSPGRILISEPCSWDMDALALPYLPYMWGVLKTYFEDHGDAPGDWEWLPPIYRSGDPVELLASRLDGPIHVLGLSCYTWNWRLQRRIAAAVKSRYPDCLVVAGGPHPSPSDPRFFRDCPDIDAVAVKDGEITFTRILDVLGGGGRDLGVVPGLYLPDPRAPEGHRFTGPAEVPSRYDVSPYLAQSLHYERIIRECGGRFCATWETNRGCPFRCSFCDWGSATMSKVRRFEPDRVSAELDWLGRHGVSVLFLVDANFGIFPSDVELSRQVADTFRRYGHPTTFNYSNAKNRPDRSVAIAKILYDSGIPLKHALSIQHTRPEVLAATDRENISSEKQIVVVRELMEHGIPVEVQLILGIPGDTYRLWQGCFGDLMEWGIHGQYQTYLYHLLPNAPAASPGFRERWALDTVERCVHLSPHLGRFATRPVVPETNDIVVGSASFSREDWVRMNAYAAWVKALHTTGLTQFVARYLRRVHGVRYEAFYRDLVDEWAAGTWWHRHVTAHFRAFLVDEAATEFLPIEEVPSYPHPVAPFQWVFVQACLSLPAFFEALGRYLLGKYPQAANLPSLLRYQQDIMVVPTYDSRRGRVFATDLDWPAFFRRTDEDEPAPEPPHDSGWIRVADLEGTDGVDVFPFDWYREDGEKRWAVWIERVVLDNCCLDRTTFREVTLSRGPPSA